jgi:signal transduction histidine kinase
VTTFGEAMRVLWTIRRGAQTYRIETPLSREGRPLATVRVVIAGALLWDEVRQATASGLASGIVAMICALSIGILVIRLAAGRIRLMAERVVAIREGRASERLPATGIDEFDRLADELNLLGTEFELKWNELERSGARRSEALDPGTELLLDQSRVLAGLGQTAAGMAHELRNHLQTVQFDLDALRSADRLSPDELRSRVESAADGVDRLGGAVRGFLKVARVRPLAPESVQVNDVIREAAVALRDEAALAGVELKYELDPSLPETLADPEVLQQAVRNLVRNSVQALSSGEGGSVWIRTANTGGTLRITVSDNGPGIPSAVLGRVFDLYFTTRKDGSGVGLALVRQSVEMHGGEIHIDSQEGFGTEIVLEMPVRAFSGRSASRA